MQFSIHQLTSIAASILEDVKKRSSQDHATLITFSGDLGAGKTTMIQEMAKQLEVAEDLSSPTYVIYKIYTIPHAAPWKHLIHGDMYRLESSSEIVQLGWKQLLEDPENIICVEWPEKITEVIPEWAAHVVLHHEGGDSRSIDIK